MFDSASLQLEGFQGFVSWQALDTGQVAAAPGVYAVLRDGHEATFLPQGTGGHFKQRNPAVTDEVLRRKWIADAPVVYIGKATSLRTRLRQYRDFGVGKPVGHWGGRYIWQLERPHELKVCWRPTSEPPEQVEANLLRQFVGVYGALPFANLRN